MAGLLAKHNEVIQLLCRAWEAYALAFPRGKNWEAVLVHITEAQRLVLEEPVEASSPLQAVTDNLESTRYKEISQPLW